MKSAPLSNQGGEIASVEFLCCVKWPHQAAAKGCGLCESLKSSDQFKRRFHALLTLWRLFKRTNCPLLSRFYVIADYELDFPYCALNELGKNFTLIADNLLILT